MRAYGRVGPLRAATMPGGRGSAHSRSLPACRCSRPLRCPSTGRSSARGDESRGGPDARGARPTFDAVVETTARRVLGQGSAGGGRLARAGGGGARKRRRPRASRMRRGASMGCSASSRRRTRGCLRRRGRLLHPARRFHARGAGGRGSRRRSLEGLAAARPAGRALRRHRHLHGAHRGARLRRWRAGGLACRARRHQGGRRDRGSMARPFIRSARSAARSASRRASPFAAARTAPSRNRRRGGADRAAAGLQRGDRTSARVIERGDKRIGYVHVWASVGDGSAQALSDALEKLGVVRGVARVPGEGRQDVEPRSASSASARPLDALIMDMRGRIGGTADNAGRYLDILDPRGPRVRVRNGSQSGRAWRRCVAARPC